MIELARGTYIYDAVTDARGAAKHWGHPEGARAHVLIKLKTPLPESRTVTFGNRLHPDNQAYNLASRPRPRRHPQRPPLHSLPAEPEVLTGEFRILRCHHERRFVNTGFAACLTPFSLPPAVRTVEHAERSALSAP